MNHHHLEDWAYRAAQTLQDFVDAAQEAAGDPDGDTELQDVRDLLRELDLIARGLDPWSTHLGPGEDAPGLEAL